MTTSSLVFIDARVSGYESLIDDLPSDTEVVVLDSHTDGLEQIAAYLSGRTGIVAIHVLSHGSQGALYLGNTRVDGDYLNHHSAQLANIGSSLSATGDILLYGCNVAQGDVGLQFIQSLADLTGADVAASVDTTGSAALGGNSVLETQNGDVQTLALDTSSLDEVLAGNTAPTFMVGDGMLTTDFGSSSASGVGVTVQIDGKILVAGGVVYSDGQDFALVRYNSDGSLDTSFSEDGKVTTDLGSWNDSGSGVTVQADGKILVTGSKSSNNNSDSDYYDFALVRYNSDGSLDTSFSDDGMLTTDLGGSWSDFGREVMVQDDGKILVTGFSHNVSSDFVLVRYNSDGSLDTSFSGDGMLTTDFDGNSATVQADGKILVTGGSNTNGASHFTLVRYNSDGSLDTSFSDNGKVTTAVSLRSDYGYSVTVQANGKILVAGTSDNGYYDSSYSYSYGDYDELGNYFSYDNWVSNSDFALVRYNSDGSLDTNFSSSGILTTDLGGLGGSWGDDARNVSVLADGKILVGGDSNGGVALVRYNSDGSLDTSFGGDGIVTTDSGSYSVVVQANGKILVAGSSYNGNNIDFALARYNSDGSLDTSFDLNTSLLGGSVTYTENAPAVVLDSDVQIYDAELAAVGYGNAVLNLARHGGAQAEDRFSGAGIVAGQSSGDVSVSGTTVGIYTWNAGTLRIVFNSNTTQELLNQTARAIAYQNTSDNPTNSIQIDWTFSDGNTGSQGIGGSLETTDSTTVNITAVNDAPTGNVTITGTAAQGQTLIADTSTLNDVDGFLGIASYQWKANGIAITGATGSTYTLTQTEVGQTISVAASYIDSQGTAEAVTSSATTAVINVNDTPTGTVTLTGTATQGQTLTASNTLADVDGLGTVSYQWNVNGSAISGAIGSTYTLSQADVGKTISVTANYTDGQGTAEAVTSAATTAVANVNDAPTGNVTLSGTATQGQTLTAANNLADADGFLSSIGYQWKANGTAITGATGSTYTLTQNEVGKSISVTASYTDGQGTAEAVTSVATTTVTNVNDTPTGTVTLTGTAAQGQTLTASNTLADVDGLGNISYQWNVNGSAISGASGSTYTLGQTDVGKTISVTASYTDGQGTAESVTSSTTVVANINDTPTGTVTLTGTATQGQTLTAANTLADVDGLGTVSYQWKANGSAITGATGSTYTLSQADVGKTISVTASYTDGQGTTEAVTSSATTAVGNVNDAPTGAVTITGTATQGQTLTAANTLTDVDGLGTISYQWKANGSAITGATGSTYTLGQAEVGKTISVTASYTDGQGTAEAVTSVATTTVTNVNDTPTGTVTLTGTAAQDQTLTASNSLADVDGLGTISYQWKANGSAITGATGSTYTLGQAEVGKTISVTASYTDGQGTTEAITSSATNAVANVNDAPTGTVTITGTATQGQTLTATNTLADVDGLGTISYQWKANGSAITGSTGTTYTLSQAEVGKTISVTASYTDAQGTAEAITSSATTAVANVNDAPTGTVTLTGTATQGQTLTAANTLADVDGLGTVSYQWNVNGSAISGASGSTYTLSQAEVGKTISVTASYTDAQGTAEAITSSATTAVANVNDAPTGAVTLTGTATQGQTLTAANTLADVDGLGTVSYQWKANGSAITGATGSTYTLGQAEVGKTISVTASYTDGQGTTEAVTSSATTAVANVNDAPTGTVTITGTATQGQTLTAANTLADIDGLGTVSYQWKANGTAITGATGTTYTLSQADVGKTISVTASYTDAQGTAEAITSSATTAVANVNDAPTGTVTITGTATQGQTLTAANTLADIDGLGTVSYQWKANGTAITGATGSAYTLGQAEMGKTISVTASYTDGQGTAEAITSSATTAVANVNDAPTGTVTLTGTAAEGQTLTAANTLADIDGLGTVSYQWLRGGEAISGATASTYTLTASDAGQSISVCASYTDGQGTLESRTSASVTPVVLEPGVVFGNAEPGQLTTTEAGGTDRFTVALRAAPRGDVTLTFTLSDATEAVFSASGTATHSVTFTADDWATPQTVVLLGVDDKPNDGDVAYTISTSVSSEDLRYDGMRSGSGLPVANLIGQTIDNDAPDEEYGDAGGVVTADLIRGGNGASDLYGLSGRDVLYGNNGDDRLYGGYGDDVLYGNADNDNLEGDQGNDKLDGGTGDDTLNGGTGNDTLIGQAGNDNLLGDVGQDTLLGGDGNDTLNGGVDADSMNGGNGADVYYIDNAADVVSDSGTDGAIDTVYIMAYLSGSLTLGNGIDNGTLDDQAGKGNLKGNSGNNALNGNTSNNVLDGGTGNDTIDGGAGVDNLTGGAGSDNLSGGLGNDVLYSGDGDDVVDAGAGNDLIIGGDGAGNDKYVGGAGIDTVKYTSATSGITVDLTKGTATSRLANDAAKIGTDTLNGIESVIAGNYNDMVNGSAVANTLRGEAGNDTLDGKAGNDTLVGGAGNDILIGGAGKDALTGSAGNDVFKFNTLTESGLTATTRDVITDFVRGQDKINLSTIDANTALAGNQAFTGLIGANVAFTKAGQLKLVAGVLYGNTDADATAEFSIALTGITTLANTDFVL